MVESVEPDCLVMMDTLIRCGLVQYEDIKAQLGYSMAEAVTFATQPILMCGAPGRAGLCAVPILTITLLLIKRFGVPCRLILKGRLGDGGEGDPRMTKLVSPAAADVDPPVGQWLTRWSCCG